jgi:hypothetical protein
MHPSTPLTAPRRRFGIALYALFGAAGLLFGMAHLFLNLPLDLELPAGFAWHRIRAKCTV